MAVMVEFAQHAHLCTVDKVKAAAEAWRKLNKDSKPPPPKA